MLKVLMNVVLCNLTRKIVKQVKIENFYIYGGKFEIKDKILPVIRRCDCSAYLDPLNVLLSQPLLSPSESPQTT